MKNYIHGVDVSRWQGKSINWKKCKLAGAKFAIIKITESNNIFDACFARNWEDARKVGLKVAAYHMVSFVTPALAQINWLRDKLAKFPPGDFPVVLDCEYVAGKNKELTIKKMLTAFPDAIIYTSGGWWNWQISPGFRRPDEWQRYPLWVANYTSNKKPFLPKDWNDWAIWQYSSTGNGAKYGINPYGSYYVDLNWMNPAFWNKYVSSSAISGMPVPV